MLRIGDGSNLKEEILGCPREHRGEGEPGPLEKEAPLDDICQWGCAPGQPQSGSSQELLHADEANDARIAQQLSAPWARLEEIKRLHLGVADCHQPLGSHRDSPHPSAAPSPAMRSLVLLVSLAALPCAAFIPNQICEGISHDAPSSALLVGKHLVVLETEFSPFAIRNASTPYGWTGFDVDLLEGLARDANFTFEIRDGGAPTESQTWTDVLLTTMPTGDLWASWWFHDAERLQGLQMLAGHIDLSPVLAVSSAEVRRPSHAPQRSRCPAHHALSAVITEPAAFVPPRRNRAYAAQVTNPLKGGEITSENFQRSLYSFFSPFSPNLWAAIVAMIMCARDASRSAYAAHATPHAAHATPHSSHSEHVSLGLCVLSRCSLAARRCAYRRCSGLVDYLLEREAGGRVFSSMHECATRASPLLSSPPLLLSTPPLANPPLPYTSPT